MKLSASRLFASAIILVLGSSAACALDRGEFAGVVAQCAACHGAEGIAKDVEIPNLAGQHDRYLVQQLQNFRSGKRTHKEMRYMSRHITDEEIEALAQYYSTLPH
ncbi:MAG TPA: c-type cytochrome [Methylocystis sp.]|nr:c-type cytochrome [Methylocystis sp.]